MKRKELVTLSDKINYVDYGFLIKTIDEVINIIRTGNYPRIIKWKEMEKTLSLIEATMITNKNRNSPDKQEIKEQILPVAAFNGVFKKINCSELIDYSSFTALDIDHLDTNEEMASAMAKAKNIPHTYAIYTTPSGNGIKIIVLHDNDDPSCHKEMYEQIAKFYGIEYDDSCKDIARRNYLCYDPNIWINPNAVPFHFVKSPVIKKPIPARPDFLAVAIGSGNDDCGISDKSIMNMLKGRCKRHKPELLCEGHRRDGVFWFACEAKMAGVDYDYGLSFVKELYHSNEIQLTSGSDFPDSEIEENFKNGYEKAQVIEGRRETYKIRK